MEIEQSISMQILRQPLIPAPAAPLKSRRALDGFRWLPLDVGGLASFDRSSL
jgi:hypothetical protein